MEIEIPPETTVDFLIRIGLYIGALFQFTCIFAIIFLPDKNSDSTSQKKSYYEMPCTTEQDSWEGPTAASSQQRNFQHKVRKQDKKKRR